MWLNYNIIFTKFVMWLNYSFYRILFKFQCLYNLFNNTKNNLTDK